MQVANSFLLFPSLPSSLFLIHSKQLSNTQSRHKLHIAPSPHIQDTPSTAAHIPLVDNQTIASPYRFTRFKYEQARKGIDKMAAPASTTDHVAEVPKQNKDKVCAAWRSPSLQNTQADCLGVHRQLGVQGKHLLLLLLASSAGSCVLPDACLLALKQGAAGCRGADR